MAREDSLPRKANALTTAATNSTGANNVEKASSGAKPGSQSVYKKRLMRKVNEAHSSDIAPRFFSYSKLSA